jgi:hypothetical protein
MVGFRNMIIFGLDGTLADCEHRLHLINKPENVNFIYEDVIPYKDGSILTGNYYEKGTNKKWQPDWPAFYEACDKDVPIKQTISLFNLFMNKNWCEVSKVFMGSTEIQIWSRRCESVRDKTIDWLHEHIGLDFYEDYNCPLIKMRPVGDYTPDDQLKEKWLDEYLGTMYPPLEPVNKENNGKIYKRKEMIDFVFDSDPKSIEMWRRRGIFVFDCNQDEKEF